MLGSQTCAFEKLQALNDDEIERVKQAFVKYNHPRFMKAFSYHLPFGAKQTYKEQINHSDTEKLAHLIKSCGFLMQMKVYLFRRARYQEEEPK